jgi:anti-sigma B factor antagonist
MVPPVFLSVTASRRGVQAYARRGPPQVVVCLRGDHDLSTVAELSAAMARAITLGDADIVVDLSRVEFMAAATVGVLVRARGLLRSRSRSLVVRSPSTRARRVLELSDLRGLIEPRSVDVRLAEAAGALRTWVAVPMIDGIDRSTEVSMLDRTPKITFVELTGPTEVPRDASSDEVHRRPDEQVIKVAS